jgi:hypothetical protein
MIPKVMAGSVRWAVSMRNPYRLPFGFSVKYRSASVFPPRQSSLIIPTLPAGCGDEISELVGFSGDHPIH